MEKLQTLNIQDRTIKSNSFSLQLYHKRLLFQKKEERIENSSGQISAWGEEKGKNDIRKEATLILNHNHISNIEVRTVIDK